MAKMRCATALVQSLEAIGVDTAFVYNGHGNWAILDAIEHESRIRGIACKGEEQAVHMADGYFRSKHKGSLALVSTSVGPGNMNIASALANAFFESSAMIVLAGAGSTHWQDRGGIEEFYRYAPDEWIQTVKHYTKKALVITRPDTAVDMLLRAYKTAVTGRPGPVVLQVPFDIQHSEIDFKGVENVKCWVDIHPPGPDPEAIRKAAVLISTSKKPLIFVSSGIYKAEAFGELERVVNDFGIPVATTTPGKGAFPEDRPLCLGATGRSGTGHANKAAGACDLVIGIGTHFTDVDTGGWTLFDIPSKTRLIHIDIDSSEISRVYPTDVGIISDAKLALAALYDELKELGIASDRFSPWTTELDRWRKEWESSVAQIVTSDQAPLNYARLCRDISTTLNATCPDASVFVDTGHLLSFAPPFYTVIKPRFFHNGFFHRMGWSLPAALGAKRLRPEHPAVALLGDGSFLFSCTTLATAYEYDLPVIAVVLNNKALQIERELMDRLYGRTAFVDFVKETSGEQWNPDFLSMATAMGAQAEKVHQPDELVPALQRALEAKCSYVLDVDIDVDAPGYRSVWYPYPMNFWQSRDELKKDF